jgi:sugar phosphate isomerase/epimerase
MTISSLPLSYCTNVHPGFTVAEIESGLDQYSVPIRKKYNATLAAGLWLAQPVVKELSGNPDLLDRFIQGLHDRDLSCYTLNAFPYGNFHSERVKENVYLPDWSTKERLEYTKQSAQILSALMPEGREGSISTVPLGFKEFEYNGKMIDQCVSHIIELARFLDDLHDESGKRIRLAIEPEPFCIIETTDEALMFFKQLWKKAEDENASDEVRDHIGLCYDVCHQSVEFENVEESIQRIDQAGIRINKLHISCAIELENPAGNPEALKALANYVEPRYLHQTMAKTSEGEILRYVDLDQNLIENPPEGFLNAECWRIHFHVPVNAENLGPLKTTRPDLKKAITSIGNLSYAPHLEVETYTWEVLPGEENDLVQGFSQELSSTRLLLSNQLLNTN